MNAQSSILLTLARLPARLDAQQTALVLGFSGHDIPILIQVKLLKPLGEAPPNAPKYFAACEIEELARSPQWLHRATKALTIHWRRKKLGRGQTKGA